MGGEQVYYYYDSVKLENGRPEIVKQFDSSGILANTLLIKSDTHYIVLQ